MGNQKATPTKETTLTRPQNSANLATKFPLPTTSAHPLLQLQRKIGNRAVSQLIQAKLKVGKPNDVYEVEADRVADHVMRSPDPIVQRQPEEKKEETAQAKANVQQISPLVQREEEKKEETAQAKAIAPITPLVQRQETEEKKEETVQKQAADEKKEETAQMLQRQATDEKKEETVQKQEDKKEETAQAKGADAPEVTPHLETRIQTMRGGGQPLPDNTRSFFESRMGYDLGGVRVHTDSQADEVSRGLNAQAFTIGQNIFFAGGRYEPQTNQGKWLLAHELTHTVQQQPQPLSASSVQRVQRQPIDVSPVSSQVQRNFLGIEVPGLDTVRNWAADRAANIPGYTLLTVILGRNPISDRPVERSAVNLIQGMLGLLPGGNLIFQGLQASGAIDRVGSWLQQQLSQLNITLEGILALLRRAWDAISITDLSGSADRVLNVFRPTLDRLHAFASVVGSRVIQFVKEAILTPVGNFARGLSFYPLLTVILGKDPITDEVVTRNATNVIGGIMQIIPGGNEKFQQLQQSGVIDRAYNWFNEQLTRLNLTWNYIKSVFTSAWDSLSTNDILSPNNAFNRIRNLFNEPVQRMSTFAGIAIRKVAEFVFEGVLTVAGGFGRQILGLFNRARGVVSTIIDNPIGFIGNLVNAVKQGFRQFGSNILTHLRSGLVGWLLGALSGTGLQLPERFDLQGIVSLVMQVLGLTYQRLRSILVRLLGSEERVQRAEQVFDFLVTLVRDGIAAAWERIMEFVGNLQEMVLGGVRDWVAQTVVGQAIARLVTLFNPAGAVIQAIMAIYNTVGFFMERAQQLGALATSVFDSIDRIASGNIAAAASYVESTMARTIPVILGFLARFIGLGNVGEQIQTIIRRIQSPIENAMNRVATWIVNRVRGLLSRGQGSDTTSTHQESDPEHDSQVQAGLDAIEQEEKKYEKEGKIEQEDAAKVAATVKANHPVFKSITVVDGSDSWDYDYVASPKKTKKGDKKSESVVPEQRYLPPSVDVRRNLYINGSGFGSEAKNVKNETLEKLREDIRRIRELPLGSPQRQSIWEKWVVRELVPERADPDKYTVAKVNAERYDVDHIKPLARHWKESGFNSTDRARQTIAGSRENLRLVLMTINRSKGGEGHHYSDKPYVGSNFSSDYNDCPTGAKKILGQYFRDKDDKALR